jgi:hypothetical protein
MDTTKPYIQVERAAGTTALIHVVMPDGTRLGVLSTEKTEAKPPSIIWSRG